MIKDPLIRPECGRVLIIAQYDERLYGARCASLISHLSLVSHIANAISHRPACHQGEEGDENDILVRLPCGLREDANANERLSAYAKPRKEGARTSRARQALVESGQAS